MRGLIYFQGDFGKKSGDQVCDRGILFQVSIIRCVDNVDTPERNCGMSDPSSTADVTINLRARSQDRMASSLKEAKDILRHQSTIFLDAETFQKVMDWMDGPATPSEAEGMKRLLQARAPWECG